MGKGNEAKAIRAWLKKIKQDESHTSFYFRNAELRINCENPHLAATPDGLFT